MSENEIIKGCVSGDRSAQNMLYDLFSGKMFALCLRYSKTREEAEDTFHEGFMKVYENIKKYRHAGSFEGWIRKIMVNTAIQKFRKQSQLRMVVSLEDYHMNGNGAPVSDDILQKIEANELMEMIQKLPPYCRIVFNLFVFDGLKHKEIAEELRITEGTSKSHLSDARAILKKAIYNLNKPTLKLSHNG
ncbi:MAG: RNA polymerase sigma factor [Bacteroidia bacterium]